MLGDRVINWEEFLVQDKTRRQSLASHFVHIITWVTAVRVRTIEGLFGPQYKLEPELADQDDALPFIMRFQPDFPEEMIPEYCEAIHLTLPLKFFNGASMNFPSPVLLIVGERSGHIERIEIATMSLACPDLYVNDSTERGELRRELAYKLYSRMKRVRKTIRLG